MNRVACNQSRGLLSTVCLCLLVGCTASEPIPPTLEGLWLGTYTVGNTDPVYRGQSFFFSFTLFADGTMTYKSETPRETVYATGNWSLAGEAFGFMITTLNYEGRRQHNQSGTAIYNSTGTTLTSGTLADHQSGGTSSWSMSKVN